MVRDATAFLGTGGATTNPSELIDMGRFMQRIEIPEVTYDGTAELTGSIQLAAMTRHFVLTHRVVPAGGAQTLDIQLTLSGDAVSQYPETDWLDGTRALSIHDGTGSGWVFLIPEVTGSTPSITRDDDGSLVFESSFAGTEPGQEVALSVLAMPSTADSEAQRAVWLDPENTVQVSSVQLQRDGTGGDDLQPATWDPERGVWLVPIRDLTEVGAPTWADWSDVDQHTWYNRHKLVVTHAEDEPISVPLAFEGGNNAAFYIVGGSPLFRDTDGVPLGAPIQISKNWHESPYWYHLYSALLLPAGSHEIELTFAHARWGEAYAAAHAQLSLIGWGTNQQWDESSLGSFGESVTYDPDLTLGRSMVDDVRPFLVDAGTKWSWTGNVGGADFLRYIDEDGLDQRLGRLRTHYASTGPNLTDVVYAGVSKDGAIEARIATQLGRTDDLIRIWYHLEYTFKEDVAYDRLALFQVAADGYGDNGFTRAAYGTADQVLEDSEVTEHETTGYADPSDRGIALEGKAPWIMLYSNEHTSGSLPEHLANVGFIVRDYRAELGDTVVTTPHLNRIRTYNGGWSQIAFELGLPYDSENPVVPAGSVITATVEYLVPPSDKGAYYGESDWLTSLGGEDFQSTAMMLKLADEGHLRVEASTGTLLRTHPVELQAARGEEAVQFTLTGGLGYVPVTIWGLSRPDGWQLEIWQDETWTPVDQSVEGMDWWQARDEPTSEDFALVFNLPNRYTEQYRLVRAAP